MLGLDNCQEQNVGLLYPQRNKAKNGGGGGGRTNGYGSNSNAFLVLEIWFC